MSRTTPRYPIYVITKGRADTRMTIRALERMGVEYYAAIEPQEYALYAAHIDPARLLVTPFSNLGEGSIPVRNFIWDHALSIGATKHWCVDDNIGKFCRLNNNLKIELFSGAFFRIIEDFTDRYTNVAMSGPQYWMFTPRKVLHPAFTMNTRVYSCILINHAIPYRWRGRYNEDTDLSLRCLKDGWCTLLIYALIQDKAATMTVKGGNTESLYTGVEDGRLKMAQSLAEQHPDVTKITWKWNRWQHHVDYSRFKRNALIRAPGWDRYTGVDNYGMTLQQLDNAKRATR